MRYVRRGSGPDEGKPLNRVPFFGRVCGLLLVAGVLLALAHVLFPEYEWGQGRKSFFYLSNRLSLASWLVSMQLVALAVFGVVAYYRERWSRPAGSRRTTWIWLAGVSVALGLSFAEITRIHHRLNLLGYPGPDAYMRMANAALFLCVLILFTWFLESRVRDLLERRVLLSGIGCWGLWTLLVFVEQWIPENGRLISDLAIGLAFLIGTTLMLRAVGGYALEGAGQAVVDARSPAEYPTGTAQRWILIGVGATTFSIIFLQIVVFQLLTISTWFLTAHTAISVALLGISVGGLIGFFTSERSPMAAMIGAGLLLPLTVLVAFGVAIGLMDTPLIASVLLTLPFICASVVITVALARSESHIVYFIDLIGAAMGAFAVSWLLSGFREEGSLLLLCAFTLVVAALFLMAHPDRGLRRRLLALVAVGVIGFAAIGFVNLRTDWLNVVRVVKAKEYPDVKVIASGSSFVGRYEVVRRELDEASLKAVENGRTIDTIRPWTEEYYAIDPRLPHTLVEDPDILILGLSGDAITKTAKLHGKSVVGIEINPVVIDIHTNVIPELNGHSYEGIEVVEMDGRTYVELTDRKFDMITLLNAHFAKGYVEGRSASAEYIHTVEAYRRYLDILTDRGVINIEEPVGRPFREPPIWKQLLTLRQALLDIGAPEPERHFFVYQWKTRRNNYYQILVKKTPFDDADLDRLRRWLTDVDELPRLEREAGRTLGPIKAITTELYAPDRDYDSNVGRVIRGVATDEFRRAYNLSVISDDKPFPFDVDPARGEVKQAYSRTLWMMLIVVPFFAYFLVRHRSQLRSALPYVAVVGLTGMGYLLIEVVLIQRYTVFLGTPVATFATVLGTLMVSSGLGSLWSGRVGTRGLYGSLAALFACLLLHLAVVPSLLQAIGAASSSGRIVLAVATIAPLGFFMGVPFPFVLRTGKTRFTESSAAMLFAINAATSALAVPLALNISTAFGLRQVFTVSIVIYAAVTASLIGANRPRLLASVNGSAYALLGLLLIAPWILSRPAQADPDASATYEVYAVSYGRSMRAEDRVFLDGSKRKSVSFEWMFFVVQGDGRTILVDTGFDDRGLAERWRLTRYDNPTARLADLGVAPEDVTDVILTHAHWDHVGNVSAFENARVWIQEREYQHASALLSEADPTERGMRWDDLQALIRIEEDGRLERLDGDAGPYPGIRIAAGGGHTPGSQYVTVDTPDGAVVIAGDTTYMFKNNTRHEPIGPPVDREENLRAIREMQGRAASPFMIIPGHDPKVMSWFPEVAYRIVRITIDNR